MNIFIVDENSLTNSNTHAWIKIKKQMFIKLGLSLSNLSTEIEILHVRKKCFTCFPEKARHITNAFYRKRQINYKIEVKEIREVCLYKRRNIHFYIIYIHIYTYVYVYIHIFMMIFIQLNWKTIRTNAIVHHHSLIYV